MGNWGYNPTYSSIHEVFLASWHISLLWATHNVSYRSCKSVDNPTCWTLTRKLSPCGCSWNCLVLQNKWKRVQELHYSTKKKDHSTVSRTPQFCEMNHQDFPSPHKTDENQLRAEGNITHNKSSPKKHSYSATNFKSWDSPILSYFVHMSQGFSQLLGPWGWETSNL